MGAASVPFGHLAVPLVKAKLLPRWRTNEPKGKGKGIERNALRRPREMLSLSARLQKGDRAGDKSLLINEKHEKHLEP